MSLQRKRGTRKPLAENDLSNWELRVDQFRVFFDVILGDEMQVVKIKAVGTREHNRLLIGGKEVQL